MPIRALAALITLLLIAPAFVGAQAPLSAGESESGGSGAEAGALTAAAAFDDLFASSLELASVSDERLAEFAKLFGDAAAAEPKEWRWRLGLAGVASQQGDAAKAREHAERAVELGPESAVAHYWHGTLIFESISEASMVGKMSLASKGRDAYERAVEIDPSHIGARFGLGIFFLEAPGLAGGSYKKASEQASALIALGGAGAHYGHMLRSRIAAARKKWDEAVREAEASIAAAPKKADEVTSLRALAFMLLREKEDAAAALPVIERLRAAAPPTDPIVDYLLGEANQKSKNYRAAIANYTASLALRPDSATLRIAIAECYEALKEYAEALRWYKEFVEKAPEHRRAGEARSAIKKLEKTLR